MSQKILRFRIALSGSDPEIWREIDVPDHYNFWELHVAIQDAMGWLDYHLHAFYPRKAGPTKGKVIGIPLDEGDYEDQDTVAGWELPLKKYFTTLGNAIDYTYDFGDDWQHEITLIGMFLAPRKDDYPQCIDGKMACPPEDSGGLHGYYDLLEILADEKHEEYANVAEWLENHAKNYWPYDPNKFSPKRVKFTDPYRRWCQVFDQPYQP